MSGPFYPARAGDEAEIRPGLFGTAIAGARSTAVRWTFPPGTPRTGLHSHDEHEQWGILISGRIELQIGDEVRTLAPGDIYYAPKGVLHGRTLVLGDEPAVIVDIFNPPREEYLAAGR
jgi:quercetin dioxygenase-like cupin family protein